MSSWPETRHSLIHRLADPCDARAWEEFEACYQPAIYRYVRSRGLQPADAMDVIQEVLIAVHKRASNWTPAGHRGGFRAWLAETARRVTLQQMRLRSRFRTVDASDPTSAIPASGHGLQFEDELDDRQWQFYCAAARVESQVTIKHWQAFWLTAVVGQRAETVATQLNMKLGTVYSVRCRVQAKIQAELKSMLELERGDK